MRDITFDRTNAICGLFFVVVSIVFLVQSLAVSLGTWNKIGPGGLPLVLSLLLMLLGIVIFIQSLRVEGEPVGMIAWRGMLFILLAPVIFGVTVRPVGFVGAVFITSLIAAFASFKMKPPAALVLAVLLTVFSTVVFSYGLGLPFQRFGPWLTW